MSIIDYLVLPHGAKKKRKRRGRGRGTGHGKTSCRGHKGQKARGMTKRTKGFEGGQMPLLRRLPKRGFSNRLFQKNRYQIINIKTLKSLRSDDQITPLSLEEKGLIKDAELPVKILGEGRLERKLDIYAHAFSKRAKKAIEEQGGKAVIIN